MCVYIYLCMFIYTHMCIGACALLSRCVNLLCSLCGFTVDQRDDPQAVLGEQTRWISSI